MSPQQTPLVVWSMVNTVDTAPSLLNQLDARASLMDEALYGADYLMPASTNEVLSTAETRSQRTAGHKQRETVWTPSVLSCSTA